MIKKILFVVMPNAESVQKVDFLADLALAADARIIALNVVDSSVAGHLKSMTGADEAETLVKLEQDGWHYLYDVEDRCKARGVKIVLQQDEGFPDSKIAMAARRYGADVVAVARLRAEGYSQTHQQRMIASLSDRLECAFLLL